MQRLSGLDASFLYLETRSQLMHVIGLVEIDPSTMPGGYNFDRLREEMERRVAAIPAFRRKLDNSIFNIDHPVWIEDEDFDIQRHVHRVAVPAPGGAGEVAELCGHLAGQTLDRGKPLWELWIIEGLSNGRICAMLRMHHAGTDGVTSAEMLAQMCTLTPDPPELDSSKVHESAGPPSRATIAATGAINYFASARRRWRNCCRGRSASRSAGCAGLNGSPPCPHRSWRPGPGSTRRSRPTAASASANCRSTTSSA
ncbi:hypothetical protein BPODLACK_02055 [Gordonia sp. YY1]|nr:hypothetical protein BPODLACK_02055 [Gordonia sp. YY1]